MDLPNISTLNEIAQSPFFGAVLLMIAVCVEFTAIVWLIRALLKVNASYRDTLLKTTVVMEMVLDRYPEKQNG